MATAVKERPILYEQQGRMDGHPVEDWLHAEAEILGKIFSHGA
jgi:hypothetical protein